MENAEPRLHLVLFNPEIPQNTGNIGRLCAYTDCRLHLIKPLGFKISDRHLKRSGMDYWYELDLHIHEDWAAFRTSPAAPRRLWLFTKHATRSFWGAKFEPGDGLLFGNEGHGAPDWLHEEVGEAQRLTVPRYSAKPLRSLNLASATAIATYEALRQFEVGA
ncbi:MAG: tRNA (cytidine/uridine-2'-O-)-methyltransferase [Puniceicoccaceae bacterium 5H]|nr:MAG: tRNA (cytidine/uridine-2'-O-)-methyltransferase [Puniceicoccaceae bacterium 5H]